MSKIIALVNLIRPGQWIKNLFLFVPIFFAGELTTIPKFLSVCIAFVAFCFVSSAVYVFNDLQDIEADKLHPTKNKRPLAAGQVTKGEGWITFALMGGIAFLLVYQTYNYSFTLIISSYLAINLAYSFGLKRVSIIEILIVSSGFVLRTIAGGMVANVEVSQWMVMMIFLLALFIALAKRRDDILVFKKSGNLVRKSIKHYSLEYINALLIMISGIIIVSYLMYVISPDVMLRFHSPYLYITSVFVVAGVMRYLQITLVENKSGSPTKILYSDNFIRIVVICWVVSFYFIIYRFAS